MVNDPNTYFGRRYGILSTQLGGRSKTVRKEHVVTTETTYRVGLIGTGRKGNGHARGYVANPRTELVAAADPDPSNLAIFLERFEVESYDDYHEMLRVE